MVLSVMNKAGTVFCILLALSLLSLMAPTASAPYPNRPIRLIVPFSAGGSNDILARLLAQRLTESLHQSVVVDNRPGAGGVIGVVVAAHAAPDGYTLVMGHIGTHAINPALYSKLAYDAERDFIAVSPIAASPNILLIHPSLPLRSVRELIDHARSGSNRINYASGGVGGSTHLSAELFRLMAKIELTHVPYKGGGPALTALLAAEVSMLFNNIVSALPHIKSMKLRAIGISSPQRSPIVPNLMTIAEAGLPGYAVVSWYGIFAPATTPQTIVNPLNHDISVAMNDAYMNTRLTDDGATIMKGSAKEFGQFVHNEIQKWGGVIRQAGIVAN